jgi:hypothetical protein
VHVVKIPVVKGSRDLVPNTISRPRFRGSLPRHGREENAGNPTSSVVDTDPRPISILLDALNGQVGPGYVSSGELVRFFASSDRGRERNFRDFRSFREIVFGTNSGLNENH